MKEQDLGSKKVVVDRPCERVREQAEQREKVEDVCMCVYSMDATFVAL